MVSPLPSPLSFLSLPFLSLSLSLSSLTEDRGAPKALAGHHQPFPSPPLISLFPSFLLPHFIFASVPNRTSEPHRLANGTVQHIPNHLVQPFNITAYGPVTPSPIDFETWGLEAEEDTGGVMTVFATIKLPRGVTKMNQVWQVGPSSTGGIPDKHDFGAGNLNAKGSLDVASGQSSGGTDSRLKERNIHGILNAVSWGILLPIGAIIARYLRKFESLDSAWFYLHVVCQLAGYALGVTGWAIGLNLGKKSKGIQYTTHRNLGIALFSMATLQITALFLRPKKDHKYRMYWNRYHQVVGMSVIVLGITNVFRGLEILSPARKWKDAYIVVLCVLGAITSILEATTCFIACRRRKLDSSDSTKKYNASGAANDHRGFQQPLSA